MRCLVAVSGGVDSVVLLDVLAKKAEVDGDKLIVAHFDHGIRDDSAADARFVAALAEKYNLEFVSQRQELGPNVSEQTARTHRYAFLRNVAKQRKAIIVTAHHRDDLIETIVINLHRGTGWRGLAVLAAHDISRPLLKYTKEHIYKYALDSHLEWVEDETNRSDRYLRNRVRSSTAILPADVAERVTNLRQQQYRLADEIDQETKRLLGTSEPVSRYFLTMSEPNVAQELMRAVIVRAGFISPTRPQIARALLAIKVAKPGTRHEINREITLDFTASSFIVNRP